MDTSKIINNPKQIMINNLKVFLMEMYNKNLNSECNTIEEIIEIHFKYDNKNTIINNIIMHANEVFQINIFPLLDYLRFNGFLSVQDIGLDPKICQKTLKIINRIKEKYGIFIRDYMQLSQNSFLLKSVESSIGNGQSLHNLKISRNDGEVFIAQYHPELLMSIITALINILQLSIQNGIYNLNETTVKNYIDKSKNFNEFLNMIVSQDNKQKEVALGSDNSES